MPKLVCMLAFANGQSLDISGPLEVFALASRQHQEEHPGSAPLYCVRIVASGPEPIPLASGLRLLPDLTCAEVQDDVDTLLVSGGMGDALDCTRADTVLVAWLRDTATRVRRVGSVCNGALLLAEAGVLDDLDATTHWSDVAELQQRYPRVRVKPDAIYTRNDRVWTSAGITSGMDMALAMVADDHGLPLALRVAKRMVMVSKRSGGQSQYSQQLQQLDLPDQFAELACWIRDNLRARLDVALLAQRMHMSPRQFNRRFRAAFDATPQKYIERLRIEAAKSHLEHTAKAVKQIAHDCGFASEEAMRRTFQRQLGVLPRAYREHFGAPLPAPAAGVRIHA